MFSGICRLITNTIMENKIREWLKENLIQLGLKEGIADLLEHILTILAITAIAFIFNYILKRVLINLINKGIHKATTNKLIQNHINKALHRIVDLFISLLIISCLPIIFTEGGKWYIFLSRSLSIAVVCIMANILILSIRVGYEVIRRKKAYKQKPIKGFMQIIEIIIYFIGVIIIVAIVINKSPAGLLTGLGAFAAVISFIFKDTILGFISGIQLSSNDMIQAGDWITVENSLANGVVTDITLITVKVQNFDNTVVTVPTYSLITTPFQNWRPMVESGGRRITVALNIDVNSIRFSTAQELQEIGNIVQLPAIDGIKLTNLELYRIYLTSYLHKNPNVNKRLLIMVRYLAPTAQGIPIQLYCFSNNTSWVIYEGIKAEILEHAIAICSKFNIKIFQTLGILPSIK